jgi:hypothetical protein
MIIGGMLLIYTFRLLMIDNVLQISEGCITDAKISHKLKWQLLPNRCYLLGGL